jgi:hypothetical protein
MIGMPRRIRNFAAWLGCSAVCLLGALAGAAPLHAAAAPSVPDFYRNSTAWSTRDGKALEPPPAGAPGARGPIGNHPDHPSRGNNTGRPTPRIGNDTSPLLTPWAADLMRQTRESIVAGGPVFDPSERCWPPGVPAIISFGVAPMYFLQNPDEVTIVYERGQLARHVYLNRPHAPNPKPSWHGESVGHYEGDTLVVDTIGLDDRSFIDIFNVPHSKALHVVERYRIVGSKLQVILTVDDPGAFTQAWSASKTFDGEDAPMQEILCQEAGEERFIKGVRPMPAATKRDF